MRKVYNYEKIRKRKKEILSKYDKKTDHFSGTMKEVEEYSNLTYYNRIKLPYAICLYFKTNITHIQNRVENKFYAFDLDYCYLEIDDIPYVFMVEEINERHPDGICSSLVGTGILRSLYNDRPTRKFKIRRTAEELWYIGKEIK